MIEKPIPDEEKERVREVARTTSIEKVAELDDAPDREVPQRPKRSPSRRSAAALRKGTINFKCHPVFCGSALKYVGVQRLLDGVIDYLPSPARHARRSRATTSKDPEKIIERKLDAGRAVLRPGVQDRQRPARRPDLRPRLQRQAREGQPRAQQQPRQAGEHLAACSRCTPPTASRSTSPRPATSSPCIGIKDAITGDTLCDQDHPIILERPTFPEPVISMSIEPKTAADKQKLGEALTTLSREDPTFQANYDEETGQTIIAGMGELHLEILAHPADARPQGRRASSASRRSPTRKRSPARSRTSAASTSSSRAAAASSATARSTSSRSTAPTRDGKPLDAETLKKLGWNDGIAFENKVFGGSIPKEYIPSRRVRRPHGRQDRRAGQLPADQRQGHADRRHLPPGRQLAGRVRAGRPARVPRGRAARPASTLLEPIMKVVVTTPEDFVGNVTGDLNRRRGLIVNSDQRGNTRIVEAEVPLSEMFGYTTELRSMSHGPRQQRHGAAEVRPGPDEREERDPGRGRVSRSRSLRSFWNERSAGARSEDRAPAVVSRTGGPCNGVRLTGSSNRRDTCERRWPPSSHQCRRGSARISGKLAGSL